MLGRVPEAWGYQNTLPEKEKIRWKYYPNSWNIQEEESKEKSGSQQSTKGKE